MEGAQFADRRRTSVAHQHWYQEKQNGQIPSFRFPQLRVIFAREFGEQRTHWYVYLCFNFTKHLTNQSIKFSLFEFQTLSVQLTKYLRLRIKDFLLGRRKVFTSLPKCIFIGEKLNLVANIKSIGNRKTNPLRITENLTWNFTELISIPFKIRWRGTYVGRSHCPLES